MCITTKMDFFPLPVFSVDIRIKIIHVLNDGAHSLMTAVVFFVFKNRSNYKYRDYSLVNTVKPNSLNCNNRKVQ